jgi:hypothetical protein
LIVWIRKWKTYRVGSPSWVWKSNLLYQVIPALLEQWAKVLFISLENSIQTTYVKLLSAIQWVNSNDIEKWVHRANTDWLKKYNNKFFLTDQLFDMWEIKRDVLRVKPDVVILDYIWLVNIKGFDEKSKYDKYSDEVKEFIQKNQSLAWIDLSNLNKDDNEEKIRMFKWFNGSAKLRNNTDFAMHFFYNQPFYNYKTEVMRIWADNKKEEVRWKNVITFFISKNRLWVDNEEEQFIINYNKWYKYIQATKEQKDLWESF